MTYIFNHIKDIMHPISLILQLYHVLITKYKSIQDQIITEMKLLAYMTQDMVPNMDIGMEEH